jgi:hypothetical protein
MKKEFTADHYLVAFLDVLGQSKKTLEDSVYPPNKKEQNLIKEKLKDTSDYILSLRTEFKKYFRRYRRLKNTLAGLSEQQKKEVQRLGTFIAAIRGVSDSIIINFSLENNTDNYVPINNILATFQGASLVYSYAMANGKPIRGGIDVGWGSRLSQDEVYGSVTAKAYRLESKEADYPRILVGESLWQYINYVANNPAKTTAGKKAIEIANKCKNLVTRDYNGKYILDVIGQVIASSEIGIDTEMVRKGYEYIIDFQSTCIEKNDKKLIRRYKNLRSYYGSRLSVWDIKVK